MKRYRHSEHFKIKNIIFTHSFIRIYFYIIENTDPQLEVLE